MTDRIWGQFPLELDSELIFIGFLCGVVLCVSIVMIYLFVKLYFFDEKKEIRLQRKRDKHQRKYHNLVSEGS